MGSPSPGDQVATDGSILEGNRYSYCDPSAAIAAYPRFGKDIPPVVAHLYPGGVGRDYPVVDVHTHLATTPDREAEVRRNVGLYAAVEASWDAASTATLRSKYPSPYLIQFNLGEYLGGFSEDRLPAIQMLLDGQVAAGAGGIKIFKYFGLDIPAHLQRTTGAHSAHRGELQTLQDSSGARLRIDDPRLYPIWQRAAKERWAVSIHVADVDSWLAKYTPGQPSTKQDLIEEFIRVVEDNPRTVFVAIHMMNLVDNEAELDQLGTYLDRYPNLYADVAARSQYLAWRDREHLRNFMIAHQDKLIFATDRTTEGEQGYEEDFKFWETDQIARTFYLAQQARGLALPADVLEKLYYKNALRAFCGHLG